MIVNWKKKMCDVLLKFSLHTIDRCSESKSSRSTRKNKLHVTTKFNTLNFLFYFFIIWNLLWSMLARERLELWKNEIIHTCGLQSVVLAAEKREREWERERMWTNNSIQLHAYSHTRHCSDRLRKNNKKSNVRKGKKLEWMQKKINIEPPRV